MYPIRSCVFALTLLCIGNSASPAWARDLAASVAPEPPKAKNKLLQMYRLYYLPFQIGFRQGRSIDEVLPYTVSDDPKKARMLTGDELGNIDEKWNTVRQGWKKRSLLLNTALASGQSLKLSERLYSHRFPLSFTLLDRLKLDERISLNQAMAKFSDEANAAFKQERFLRSLAGEMQKDKFHFFIVSPSWCTSSREYRLVLENYLREFPQKNVVLHSIVLEDPQNKIFESKLIREMFPFPQHYSHETMPRFLALEFTKDVPTVFEEADALELLQARYLDPHRGFLEGMREVSSKH